MELKSKLDTSTFQESSGVDTESKSFGIEASVAETENEKPPITTGMYINIWLYSLQLYDWCL